MRQSPCYNCEVRTLGCHSSCERYISFRTQRDEELQRKAVAYECSMPTERTRRNLVKTGTLGGTLRRYK